MVHAWGRRRVPRVEGERRCGAGASARGRQRAKRAASSPLVAVRAREEGRKKGEGGKEKRKKEKKNGKRGKGGKKKKRERKRESECAGADRGGRSRVGDKPPSGAGWDGNKEKGEGYGRRKRNDRTLNELGCWDGGRNSD